MATSDKPSDKVGGLTNRLIMVDGLIMDENEKQRKEEKENQVALKYLIFVIFFYTGKIFGE